MQKNFKTSSEGSTKSTVPDEKYFKKFEKIRKRIYSAQKQNLNNQMLLKAKQNVINGISSYQIVSIEYKDIVNQLSTTEKELVQLNDHLTVLCDEMSLELSRSSDQFIESIMININSKKIERGENRLKNIVQIQHASNTIFEIAEILWILMQIDCSRFKVLETASKYDKYIEQADGINRRNVRDNFVKVKFVQ